LNDKEQRVTLTLERFETGTTFAAYRERILKGGGIMRDLLETSERALAREAIDVEPFTRLPAPLRVLVLSEDWCGDCTDNLPVLNRLAEESGKLEVRILPRDEHLDIMDRHLKGGQFRSIPLMLFLDADLNEVGCFVERPDSVTELRARKRQEIYAAHQEFGTPQTPPDQLSDETRAALQTALLAMRDEVRPFAIQEVVRELTAIVTGTGGDEGETRRST
jgi:Thioredoxin